MLATCSAPRRHLFFQTSKLTRRSVSTIPQNPHIYIHPYPARPQSYLLSFLPTSPPNPDLAIASTTTNPPTPASTTENPHFFELLHSTIARHAHQDPAVQAQAAAFASQGGATLGTGGAGFGAQHRKDKRTRRGVMDTVETGAKTAIAGQGGAGGASAQGGMGGGGTHGFIHVSDERNPPDWGRVAWPEDIFGSLEVDARGEFVDGTGRYQRSGTYRVVTNEGVLGLSGFLRERVVAALKEVEGSLGR